MTRRDRREFIRLTGAGVAGAVGAQWLGVAPAAAGRSVRGEERPLRRRRRDPMLLDDGPMWDLAESPVSIALLESFYNSGKPIALVCHSPGVLRHVTYRGAPLVKGKRVTGFTNGEEEAVHLTDVVPFLVEDELKRLGAIARP